MKNIKTIFDENKGIVPTRTLLQSGINHYQLNHCLEQGWIVKLKQGLYKWKTDELNEWEDLSHLVPQGILCSFTACLHYGLSTFVSSSYHLAIPKKAKIVLPDYPPIQLYYWETTAFQLGIRETLIQGTLVKMYDREKTVCDMLRFRNKVGIDIAKEVLKNYLNQPHRDLAKLHEYARKLKIATLLTQFLTILL